MGAVISDGLTMACLEALFRKLPRTRPTRTEKKIDVALKYAQRIENSLSGAFGFYYKWISFFVTTNLIALGWLITRGDFPSSYLPCGKFNGAAKVIAVILIFADLSVLVMSLKVIHFFKTAHPNLNSLYKFVNDSMEIPTDIALQSTYNRPLILFAVGACTFVTILFASTWVFMLLRASGVIDYR